MKSEECKLVMKGKEHRRARRGQRESVYAQEHN